MRMKALAISLLFLPLVFLPSLTQAATLTVTKEADTADGSCDVADCSLREAVIEANANVDLTDTIVLPAGDYLLTIGGSDDTSLAGDLDLTSGTITIEGAGADVTGVRATGLAERVFHTVIGPLADVTIQDITIADGVPDDEDGGGILHTAGTLTLDGVVLESNEADNGGAISSSATLVVQTSSFFMNTATPVTPAGGGGGALNNELGATATLTDVTIADNTAVNGGGIFNAGEVFMTSVSLYDNEGSSSGGGLFNRCNPFATAAEASLTNVTVTTNSALTGDGGGISNLKPFFIDCIMPTVTLVNSIVADNTAGSSGPDCNDKLNDVSFSLIGSSSDCIVDSNGSGTNNFVGMVAELATCTDPAVEAPGEGVCALTQVSQAVNSGEDASCPASDQLGQAREGICDMGAVEFITPSDPGDPGGGGGTATDGGTGTGDAGTVGSGEPGAPGAPGDGAGGGTGVNVAAGGSCSCTVGTIVASNNFFKYFLMWLGVSFFLLGFKRLSRRR